jgi:FkbM family methyltransferase
MPTLRPGTSDEEVWQEVYMQNCYELPSTLIGKTVVDIGAHIGVFAIACAERGALLIECYESAPENARVLRINTAGIPAARVFEKAVWRSDRYEPTVRLGEFPAVNCGGANVLAEYGPEVPTISLDDICRKLRMVDLIKLDCEGSEYPILLTATELGRVRNIVGEWHDQTVDVMGQGLGWPVLEKCLKRNGFDVRGRSHHDGLGLFWARSWAA